MLSADRAEDRPPAPPFTATSLQCRRWRPCSTRSSSEPVPTIVAEPAQLVVLVVNVAAAGSAKASTLPPLKTAAATRPRLMHAWSARLANPGQAHA